MASAWPYALEASSLNRSSTAIRDRAVFSARSTEVCFLSASRLFFVARDTPGMVVVVLLFFSFAVNHAPTLDVTATANGYIWYQFLLVVRYVFGQHKIRLLDKI